MYDTMHGMRGEVSVIVKVELFSDVNKFRQSSCGVQFFSSKQFFFVDLQGDFILFNIHFSLQLRQHPTVLKFSLFKGLLKNLLLMMTQNING